MSVLSEAHAYHAWRMARKRILSIIMGIYIGRRRARDGPVGHDHVDARPCCHGNRVDERTHAATMFSRSLACSACSRPTSISTACTGTKQRALRRGFSCCGIIIFVYYIVVCERQWASVVLKLGWRYARSCECCGCSPWHQCQTNPQWTDRLRRCFKARPAVWAAEAEVQAAKWSERLSNEENGQLTSLWISGKWSTEAISSFVWTRPCFCGVEGSPSCWSGTCESRQHLLLEQRSSVLNLHGTFGELHRKWRARTRM